MITEGLLLTLESKTPSLSPAKTNQSHGQAVHSWLPQSLKPKAYKWFFMKHCMFTAIKDINDNNNNNNNNNSNSNNNNNNNYNYYYYYYYYYYYFYSNDNYKIR